MIGAAITGWVLVVAMAYLIFVMAERNRRLVAKCKDQRELLALMSDGGIDDGKVRIVNRTQITGDSAGLVTQGRGDQFVEEFTSGSGIDDVMDDWLANHEGVNPQAQRNEK